jgi:hypothetical protein
MADGAYVKVYVDDRRVANVPNANLRTVASSLSGSRARERIEEMRTMTTISRRTIHVAAVVAALVAANAAPAHAQLGGLKKKLKQAAGQTPVQQATDVAH